MQPLQGRFLRWTGLGHTCGVKVLRIDRPDGRRVLKFDGPSGRGLWIAAFGGYAYKVSVTGLAFWVRWHDKHYDDEPPSVAFPPFGALRHHLPPRGIGRATKGKRLYEQARRLTSPDVHILCRMCTVDNKAPQSNPFTQRIAKHKVPPPGGRWWRQPPKGVHFPRPQGGCKGFIIRGRLL